MNSTTDKAVQARVAGKELVAKRTIWQLEIGHSRFRCVWTGTDFTVQHRTDKGWSEGLAHWADPADALRRVACCKAAETIVRTRQAKL